MQYLFCDLANVPLGKSTWKNVSDDRNFSFQEFDINFKEFLYKNHLEESQMPLFYEARHWWWERAEDGNVDYYDPDLIAEFLVNANSNIG